MSPRDRIIVIVIDVIYLSSQLDPYLSQLHSLVSGRQPTAQIRQCAYIQAYLLDPNFKRVFRRKL